MKTSCIALFVLLCMRPIFAARPASEPQAMTWTIDGTVRQALVYAPAKSGRGKVPLIFAFHGSGDTAEHFSIAGFQDAWPQAVIVYMQGLQRNSGPGGAFQTTDTSTANPDLKFFDTVLVDLRQKFRLDDARIYAAGFSNGARFVYVLWATRSQIFASFAIVAGTVPAQLLLKDPKSIIHIAGREDHNVEYLQQMESVEAVRTLNGATGTGESCGKDCTLYRSSRGAPVITVLHNGGHLYPPNATDNIVTFFRAHP